MTMHPLERGLTMPTQGLPMMPNVGIATPQQDIELIKSRLRDAEEHYRARADKGGRKP
jgi:hypothetical protein